MVDQVRREPQPIYKVGLSASWRALIAAWVLVVLLVILSAGAEALASRRHAVPQRADVAGAVIPRHDPACANIPNASCPGFGSIMIQMDRSGERLW